MKEGERGTAFSSCHRVKMVETQEREKKGVKNKNAQTGGGAVWG